LKKNLQAALMQFFSQVFQAKQVFLMNISMSWGQFKFSCQIRNHHEKAYLWSNAQGVKSTLLANLEKNRRHTFCEGGQFGLFSSTFLEIIPQMPSF